MNQLIVAIRDRATDSYGQPFFVQTTGQAIRMFSDEINREAPDNQLHKHSSDFDLFHLGFYDTDTGLFVTDTPRQLAVGKELKVKANGSL